MRKKKLKMAFAKEVTISREGEYAHIDFSDPTYASCRIHFGEKLTNMTDEEVLKAHNEIVRSQMICIRESRPTEMAEGCQQVKFDRQYGTWSPESDVLRCEITSGDHHDDLVIAIDDKELSLEEFGEILKVHIGWGMRVTFLPVEQLIDPPAPEVLKRSKR